MKRIAVIVLVSYLAFMSEFVLYNALGTWGKPEFLILVIVFFNLYLGVRYSLIAAVCCGILKDASGIAPFGTYLLVYVAAAFTTTFVRRYLYEQGSRFSRSLVAFFVVVICFILQAVLTVMNHQMRLHALLADILIPQLLTTMAVSTLVFQQLKDISGFFKLKS